MHESISFRPYLVNKLNYSVGFDLAMIKELERSKEAKESIQAKEKSVTNLI